MDKQYILAEITRTARINGGLPLGQGKFLKETGIKTSDWSGKYWARWGEAVREAGFEPNQMQSAYDDDMLMESLISMMRELGHFPVRNELRLKARKDPSFPNEKTFARLGGGLGRQLAARVRSYCASRTGYGDVLALCSNVPVPGEFKVDSNIKVESDINEGRNFGFAYLMKSGRFYKIGRTNAVGRREYELGIQLPERANVIHQIRTDDPVGIEEYWHKRFGAKRKNGEWFDLSTSDVGAFTRRKFM